MADYNDKNIFDIQKHLSTRLKLKAEDEYEVIEVDVLEEEDSPI